MTLKFNRLPSILALCAVKVLGQEDFCHVQGSCSGLTVSAGAADSYFNCNLMCQSFENCSYFTFFETIKECVLFYDCSEVDYSCSGCEVKNNIMNIF